MPIRRLPPDAINRIAAGEVIERPAAAVKELVENALDAGARRVRVAIENGGLSRLLIEDDGHGIPRDELALAVERHATSKLQAGPGGAVDLLNIFTMGFRGEALPSIGAVARLTITSRAAGCADAFAIDVEGGAMSPVRPAAFAGAGASGTAVDVRDLFFATPARLKFMKTARAETMAIMEAMKRLAMARADVAFFLDSDGRSLLKLAAENDPNTDGRRRRLAAILGADFAPNAIAIDAERDGVRLSGFAGLPTFSRTAGDHQHLFVNGRPVKDKLILGAVRAAYHDLLARDRRPVAALFVDLSPEEVDVNVHPAKTEVRFRDSGSVRGLIVGALRHALAAHGHRASTTVAGDVAIANAWNIIYYRGADARVWAAQWTGAAKGGASSTTTTVPLRPSSPSRQTSMPWVPASQNSRAWLGDSCSHDVVTGVAFFCAVSRIVAGNTAAVVARAYRGGSSSR